MKSFFAHGIGRQDISAFAPLTAVSKRSDLGGVSPDELMAGQMPKVDDGGDGTNLGDDDHVPWMKWMSNNTWLEEMWGRGC